MAPGSVMFTAAALAATGSSLLLTGCGAGGTTTAAPPPPSPTPAPGPPPPAPAPAPDAASTTAGPTPAPAPAPTTMATTQAPTPAPTEAPTEAPTTTTCPELPSDACIVTETHGCLDGESFDYSEQFPCGAKQPPYTRVALYNWKTTSCCAQGVPFDSSDGFCCYDGVHSFSAGECKDWAPDDPPSCTCTGSSSSAALIAEARAAVDAEVVAVDTLSTTPSCPCGGPTETKGCLNGHLYDYATEMPCGNYIANVNTHGCCPTADGIKTYSLENESCCREGDANVIHSTAHACECRQYGCDNSLFSTVI